MQIINNNSKLQEVQLNSRDLIELICGLMTAVGSSASIETVFSTFGLVHSKVRNRLGVDCRQSWKVGVSTQAVESRFMNIKKSLRPDFLLDCLFLFLWFVYSCSFIPDFFVVFLF